MVPQSFSSPTFEALRQKIAAAPLSSHAHERRITWVGGHEKLAYARDEQGHLEVFLVGNALPARDNLVRERLVHDRWETADRGPLPANRLWLPAGDHYDAIAATILIELLEKEYERDPRRAFRLTEPLVALVMGQAHAESAAITGLAGELLLLTALMRNGDVSPDAALDSWQGWGRSSRDFQLGGVGIEVKTSTTSSSRHHIQGWYQIERGVAADGTVETALYLLSIGIQWLPFESRGLTIEALVQEALTALSRDSRTRFVGAVRNYCGLSLLVDDEGFAGQESLRRPFLSSYERLYDLQDEHVHLPRSADLALFSDLISDSVRFEIELPERVRGDRNPISGLQRVVAQIVERPADPLDSSNQPAM